LGQQLVFPVHRVFVCGERANKSKVRRRNDAYLDTNAVFGLLMTSGPGSRERSG